MDKEDTLALLRSLLISKKGGYELQELMRDFKGEAGHPLPLFGYKTPLDFLKSVPDILQLIHGYHKIMVKPIDSSKSAHIASLVRRQKCERSKHRSGSRFSSKMYYDVDRNDTNVESCRIMMDAKKLDNSNLSVGGDKNIKIEIINKSSLVKNQVDKFKSVKSDIEVDYKKLKTQICNGKNIDCGKPNIETMSLEMEINIYDHILKELNEIPKLNLKSFAKIDKYVEVCVAAICTPHNFTIQLRRFKIKLLNLMMEIQSFYNKNGNLYKITDSGLEINQLCIALVTINADDAHWCRAIVLEYKDKYSTVVGLIDYGVITEVNISKIRFMHHWFGKLPPQAISGHLANIRPFSGAEWSEESIARFQNLVFERDLVAGVVDLDYEEMWLSVALSFTDETDLHINDTLVEENLAVFDTPIAGYRTSLPWTGKKDIHSLSRPIQKLCFRSRNNGQSENKQTELKEEHSEANTNLLLCSYSESNVRLHEMFLQ